MQDYEDAVAGGELPSQRGVHMSADDFLRKDVIHSIMCHGAIDVAAFERRHEVRFEDYFAAELERLRDLEADGLVLVLGDRVLLTPAGRLLMRTVAMTFDAYTAAARSAGMSRLI
jgi:oxygen-independent coproporphyrinogen-3 oxidase